MIGHVLLAALCMSVASISARDKRESLLDRLQAKMDREERKRDNKVLAKRKSKRKERSRWWKTRKKSRKNERMKRKKLKKEMSRKQRREQRRLKRKKRLEADKMEEMAIAKKEQRRKEAAKKRIQNQVRGEKSWKEFRAKKVKQKYELGKYASRYKQPAWPTYATMLANKHLLNVGFTYNYATDSYSNEGNNHDITKLTFGENPIRVRDLLVVSDLVASDNTKVAQHDFGGAATPGADAYLGYFANEQVDFLGETEDWTTNFDLSRYIWKRNIVFGIQVPIVYKKNRLHAKMDLADGALALNAASEPNTFMRRYGQDTGKFMSDILKAKGMTDLGGSAAGLGDITLHMHANIKSHRFENLMLGARVLVPTAKKRSEAKLWAPEIGNGGFVEFGGFAAIVMYKSKLINPHILLQASGSWTAHVDRRTPRRLNVANDTTNAQTLNTQLGQSVAFGDRVKLEGKANLADPALSVDRFEAPFRNIADNIARVKIQTGERYNVRVGNMIEKLIYRDDFFDLYYDLKVKSRDSVSGVDTQIWNTQPLVDNTYEVAHTVGGEYSYQFDKGARLRIGSDYTFAGRNVPKLFSLRVNMNHSF